LLGDVFTPEMIEHWVHYKREKEINPLRLRPHPLEYSMYFDV
jgi:glutamine synthetase